MKNRRPRKGRRAGSQPQRSAPRHFQYKYGPKVMLGVGPMFIAGWGVPQVVRDQLQKEGKAAPAPIFGAMLLDTGASGTCISKRVAESLGLRATRIAVGYGAGGRHENPVYLARLHISIQKEDGARTAIELEKEVQGIPDLHKPAEALGLQMKGAPAEVVGLAGRDLLQFTKFQYDGVAGVLRVVFDLGAIPAKPTSS